MGPITLFDKSFIQPVAAARPQCLDFVRVKMSMPFWLRVPSNRIIDRTDNPTNRGVVCFTPEAGGLCFVRPAES